MAPGTKKTTTAPAGRRFDAETLIRIKSAPAWRPATGDRIEGTIVAIVPRDGDFGRYPVVILDTGDESYTAVHAFHGVLANELREMQAAPGRNITILYSGKREHNSKKDTDGNARQYHGYSTVDTDGGDLDVWDFNAAPDQTNTDEPGY